MLTFDYTSNSPLSKKQIREYSLNRDDKKADIYDKPDRKLKQTIKKVYKDKIALSDR